MLAGKITRLPESGRNRLDLLLVRRCGHHHDEGRQIFVQAAQTVTGPGSEAGAAGDLISRLHVGDSRFMIDRLGMHRADVAKVVGDFGGPRQQFCHPHAALAPTVETCTSTGRSEIGPGRWSL
jgi:Lon protease-like protein